MPETIRFSLIGKADIRFGKGTFEVTLADGSVVILEEVDIGKIANDAGLSSAITNIDDFSATVAAMQATTTPGAIATESLATNLQGEIERLRFVINRLIGSTQWYEAPTATMEEMFFGIFQ